MAMMDVDGSSHLLADSQTGPSWLPWFEGLQPSAAQSAFIK